MADSQSTLPAPRSIWMRGLLMILMAFAFQVACTVLGLLALVQFVLAAASDGASPRLKEFGQQLGQYLRQIVDFESFASEDVPFPFTDWPLTPQ